MTPSEFAAKWSASTVKETSGYTEHFIDLCQMLGYPTPVQADPAGDWYAFQKGAEKTEGGDGFADVWKRGHFGWEYKGKKKDLDAAYKQLLDYREALENPPLLVVSDMDRFEVHTNFTNTVKQVFRFDLAALANEPQEPLRILRAVMGNPEGLRPSQTRDEITREAAKQYAAVAISIRERGYDPQETAHFLNKVLFAMFAEDAGLLPSGILRRLIDATQNDPVAFAGGLSELFGKMSEHGGLFGTDRIEWFNGGLFDGAQVVELTKDEIKTLLKVSKLDWSQVEPAIFGTLFERGLDPDKRSQLGAHYTDRASIERLVEPVVIAPLRRELEAMKAKVMEIGPWRHIIATTPFEKNPRKQFQAYLDRLRSVTVLDPACGSGNFLYIALQALKDLEREAIIWGSQTLRTSMQYPQIGPEAVKGIELNLYAAEIARVVIWIGEIQWMLNNGFAYRRNPILRPLENIECRDALLDRSDVEHPVEATWPDATFIVGNPPFLGNRLLRRQLDNQYTEILFGIYGDRLPNSSDFCCYWHEKARAQVANGKTERAGLLATQAIRSQQNRRVLERINQSGRIFEARASEPWVLEGATVRVSYVAQDDGSGPPPLLEGREVPFINSNLTSGADLTTAKRLRENRGVAFYADIKGGSFEVSEAQAQGFLALPNPHGRPNSEVVVPWLIAKDITERPRKMWIVDFGVGMPIEQAALFEAPFRHVEERVKPFRATVRRAAYRTRWWLHAEPVRGMRRALEGLSRFIVTPAISKHRLFVWVPAGTLPDHRVVVIARDDDYSLGVLQSRIHEVWSLAAGARFESRPSYTPTTTFETFPFPRPPEGVKERIGEAAKQLVRLRSAWLDPPGIDEQHLRKRTLTSLYNQRPAWLTQAHERLDQAVADAYGWPADLGDEEILGRLLELNLARADDS